MLATNHLGTAMRPLKIGCAGEFDRHSGPSKRRQNLNRRLPNFAGQFMKLGAILVRQVMNTLPRKSGDDDIDCEHVFHCEQGLKDPGEL
jgi:hypothetical protein